MQYRNWFFRSLAKPELLLLDRSGPERFEFEHDPASDDEYLPLEPPVDAMCAVHIRRSSHENQSLLPRGKVTSIR